MLETILLAGVGTLAGLVLVPILIYLLGWLFYLVMLAALYLVTGDPPAKYSPRR